MPFYNRYQETDEILTCMNNPSDCNKIIILTGKTGVGKSEFVKMLLDTKLQNRRTARVHVSKSSPDTIENLHYINSLYRTFAQLAEVRIFDDIPTPMQHGLFSLKNLVRLGAKVLWSKGLGSENLLYVPVDEVSIIQKRDYIVSLLKNTRCIVSIDNIQNIDSQSFEIIKDIVRKIEHTTFIWEYTLEDCHTQEQFCSFYNECLDFNAEIYAFEIKKLDFDEAKKIAPQNVPEARLYSIYQKSEGNLVAMLLSSNTMSDLDNPICFHLAHLDKHERFLLNLVFLNGGIIKQPFLFSLLLNSRSAPLFPEPIIESTLEKLKRDKVLRRGENGDIYISHDSIISELETQPANPALFLSFQVLKESYMEKLRTCPDEDTVEHLFPLLLRFSDEDFLALFPYVQQLVLSYKYRQPMIDKLAHFREMLTQKGTVNYGIVYEISLALTTLCIKLGLAEEAQNSLNLIYSADNPYHRALQAAIFSLNFTNEECFRQVELLKQMAKTPREHLTIELFILSANMARLPTEENLKTIRFLLNREEYLSLFEYVYLLRDYAELVSDYNESLRIYGQVLKRLRAASRQDLYGQIFVAMSMFNAYQGNLKNAQKLLTKAEKVGGVPLHYLLNNKAVISILQREQSDQTVCMLSDALLITGDSYERCIIKSNLLVCYTLLNNRECAVAIHDSLLAENYTRFSYEEFQHIIYQNMLFYHLTYGETKQAEQFREKIRMLLKTALPDSMTYRLATLQLSEEVSPQEFYSQFPFRVDFLGNWDLEVSREIECLLSGT